MSTWLASSQGVLAGVGVWKKTMSGGRGIRRNMSDSAEVVVVEAAAGVLL